MAGSQIAVPINAASDWSDFVDFTERIARGYHGVSLTNYENTSEPQIAAGSGLEVGGAFYQFTALESMTGWSGVANDTVAYIKVVPAGTSITAEFTDSAPTWSTSKQGWYDSNDRYIFELYRGASSAIYAKKRALLPWAGQANLTGDLTGFLLGSHDPGSNILHANSPTNDTIFDALAPEIPVVGDRVLVSGCVNPTGQFLVPSYAERASSTQITIYGVSLTTGNITNATVVDGNGSTYTSISIAW